MNIQTRHIRSFVAVAELRSFARAAERVCVSQPALSQTILQLEQIVGFALFERTTRSVMLTEQGRQLLARAAALNDALTLFQDEAKRLQRAMKNVLRVGYMIGTAVEFIPGIVREFERVRPDATLRLQEFDFHDPTAGLRDGKVDCAIIRPPVGLEDIDMVDIVHERCVVCLPVGHLLCQKDAIFLADILDEPIIAAPGHGVWRDYWLASSFRVGRPAQVLFEAATVESELQAIATGRGISITAESTARFYARPGVVFMPIEDMPACSVSIGHLRKPGKLVTDFVGIAKKIVGNAA
jgi:DNA-binding transcriptional LysR family regulator